MGNQERKLNLKSKDMISHNVELIKELFPHCITEQDGKKVVDFEKLKQEFSDDIVDETKEKYELTWPGKREAIREARISTTKTLLPDMNKSVDFENTNNVYIEGDNLEVLKVLQESYLNKIKCIYIDPPYNTGDDLIYKNDYSTSEEDELLKNGTRDVDGLEYFINKYSEGKFHSSWLSMMYSRIKLSRNLLTKDGFIIVAIDHNELHNLKKILDEIFGEYNFLGYISIKSTPQGRGKKHIDPVGEYYVVYAKNKEKIQKFTLKKEENIEYSPLLRSGSNSRRTERPLRFYPILVKEEKLKMISDLEYKEFMKTGNKKTLEEKYINQGYSLVWPLGADGEEKVWQRKFERVKEEIRDYIISDGKIKIPGETERPFPSILDGKKYSNVEHGSNRLRKKYFNGRTIFDFPKSVYTVQTFLNNLNSNDIILDFFSGSGTTAEATFLENVNNTNKNLKFILVQIPQEIKFVEKGEKVLKTAYDFCIDNNLEPIIPSIAQERIKRAGAKIKEETGADIDYGFRVYKLSESILNCNKILPKDMTQTSLDFQASKYLEGTRKEDIVSSIILDLGLMLDGDIKLLDDDCYVIEENLLFICLSDSFNISTLDKIKEIEPDQVVLSEDSFEEDDVLTNTIQEIKNINSDIQVKLI